MMAGAPHQQVFDAMNGPYRREYKLRADGDSVVVSLDPKILGEYGVSVSDDKMPLIDEFVHREQGKIVIDLEEMHYEHE